MTGFDQNLKAPSYRDGHCEPNEFFFSNFGHELTQLEIFSGLFVVHVSRILKVPISAENH